MHLTARDSTDRSSPPALFDQYFHSIAVRDAHYVLFDDRAVVERRRHVVAGGADRLTPRRKAAWYEAASEAERSL